LGAAKLGSEGENTRAPRLTKACRRRRTAYAPLRLPAAPDARRSAQISGGKNMLGFLLDPFTKKAKELLIEHLKRIAAEVWREKWSMLAKVWRSIVARIRGNMYEGIKHFFETKWLWQNEKDEFADKQGEWKEGYSVPLDYLRENIKSYVFKKNLEIDEFKAAGIDAETVAKITKLFLDYYFENVLKKEFRGNKIGQSDYIFLDLEGEAYRVNADEPAFHVMVKLGRPKSYERPQDVVRAWKQRLKSTPPRYKRGSFYASKLERG
jgi:hypothetical protein